MLKILKSISVVMVTSVLGMLILLFVQAPSIPRAEAASGNLALTGIITASSSQSSTYAAQKAADGDQLTYWNASTAAMPQWLHINLGSLHSLTKIDQTFNQDGVWKYKIEGSIDNANWATLIDHSKGASGQSFSEGVNGSYQYVRLTVTGSTAGFTASSKEFTIIGSNEGYNIAAGKTMTAKSNVLYNEPFKAADGNTSTYWCASSGSYAGGGQWLQVDLGSASMVTGVEQHFMDVDTWGFKIEGSLNESTWTMLLDRQGTTSPNVPTQGQSFKQAVSGMYRYVKLTITSSAGNKWAASSELKVLGFENLALGKSGTASSEAAGHEVSKATDANSTTFWGANSNLILPQWMIIDLGGLSNLKRIEQSFMNNNNWKFKLEGSVDSSTWVSLMDKTGGETGQTFGADVAGQYRYIRLTVNALSTPNGNWPCSQELKVFGTPISRNLALGSSATSSTHGPGHEAKLAVDGDPVTYWGAIDSQVVAPKYQWLKVDLGNASLINRIEQSFVDSGTWRYKIEGSLDDVTWTSLVDKTSSPYATGRVFSHNVSGKYRYIKLTVTALSSGSNWPCSQELRVFGIGSSVSDKWWESSSGVQRFYTKYYTATDTLPHIISQLDAIKAKGFAAIELMAPYTGPADVWAGLGATDNYTIDPAAGTMADFENLISLTHSKGLKVIFFGNVGYARDTASFFGKAQDDNKTNTYSKERMWFHFGASPGDRWYQTTRAANPGENVYYYAYWGQNIPSYNFNSQEWRDESKKYIRFWMDKGIDGFAVDAVENYDGITIARNNESITDVLRDYDTFANGEGARGDGSNSREFVTDWHYNVNYDYSFASWCCGGLSKPNEAMTSQNPSGLDGILKGNRDTIVNVNGITQNQPTWENQTMPANKRLLETATLATTGHLLYLHNGSHLLQAHVNVIPTWSATDQTMFYKLFKVQNSYKALSPSGIRVKLATNNNNKFYAFKRTNKDGSSKALVILNYQNSSQSITVNLANTDIGNQTPINLLTGSAAAGITSTSYTVTLPAYGFTILGVN